MTRTTPLAETMQAVERELRSHEAPRTQGQIEKRGQPQSSSGRNEPYPF